MTIRKHCPSLYHMMRDIYEEQCDTEQMIMESEAETRVKEQQMLKFAELDMCREMALCFKKYAGDSIVIKALCYKPKSRGFET
jgi:hypothetical protein